MKEAVIETACRSAVGKAPKGFLSQTRPEHMGVTVVKELIRRTPGLNTQEIEDVIIGCSFPEAQQGLNLGRVLVSATGLPWLFGDSLFVAKIAAGTASVA